MSIQTHTIEQNDDWHSYMASVFQQWDDALNAEGFKPETIELLECDHASSDRASHAYLVSDTVSDEKLLLCYDDDGDAIVVRQGKFTFNEWGWAF